MDLVDLRFRSEALGKDVSVSIILPGIYKGAEQLATESVKVLYLLHGLSGDHKSWMAKTAIDRYATTRRLAVVMPNADRSWYTDTAGGLKYFTFLTEELPRVIHTYFRGLSKRPEDTYIGGLSMGGYGAAKAALTYPENYAGFFTLSGAFNIWAEKRLNIWDEWRSIFGFDLQSPQELIGTKHDVLALARKLHEEGKPFPAYYMWCGESDGESLLDSNRQMHGLLEEMGVEHVYEETEGNHSWKWWDLHVQDALNYLLGPVE